MKKILLLVLILSFSACATMTDFIDPDMTYSTFQPAGGTFSPYQGEVKILDKEPRQFTKVGTIRTTMEADSWEEVFEEMKRVAAKKGANAIIIKNKEEVKREEGDKAKAGNVSFSSYRLYYEKSVFGLAVVTTN
jgi:hypothetical protein